MLLSIAANRPRGKSASLPPRKIHYCGSRIKSRLASNAGRCGADAMIRARLAPTGDTT
jgi:hypothetical protein